MLSYSQYISNWHKVFEDYIQCTLGFIAKQMTFSDLPEEGKLRLNTLKLLLEDQDVQDVRDDLSNGIASDLTLEKTEIIYNEIASFFIDITSNDDKVKSMMKECAKMYEHYQKEVTRLQMRLLKNKDSNLY